MKIKPLHDRVVVRRIEEEARTPGGVIIPDTAKEKPMQGEVVAVGPGARDESGKRIQPDVKEGDTIPSCSANGRAPRPRSTVRSC
jgi:chaperonin GroES